MFFLPLKLYTDDIKNLETNNNRCMDCFALAGVDYSYERGRRFWEAMKFLVAPNILKFNKNLPKRDHTPIEQLKVERYSSAKQGFCCRCHCYL